MILLAAALLVLVAAGLAGLVALGVWESRMAVDAPRDGALLLLANEVVSARRAAAAEGEAAGAAVARPVRALRAVFAQS